MRVNIQSLHFKTDQKLEEFISSKLEKLDNYFEGIVGSEVLLRLENVEDESNKITEIKLSVPGSDYLFAKKQSKTFEQATDLAVEALRKQLMRHKNRLRRK